MRLTFLGGARTVTGSMHLLTLRSEKILLECGLFQGHRKEAEQKNRHLPFDPQSIDALVLSHAHIDHSGNIPTLVKRGFDGPIYSTVASLDLASLMLRDSAYLHEKDVEYVNKKHLRQGESPSQRGGPLVEPLYRIEDALRCLENFTGIQYHRPFEVADSVTARFIDAGHILGSAQVLFDVREDGRRLRLGFTGDLGRKNKPILRDPELLEDIDVLIMESTYGNRFHAPYEVVMDRLAEVVRATAERGGKVIVPAFAVDRTQELVYRLHQLVDQKRIPEIPIFVDSPLATDITEVFRMHPECYDRETHEYLIQSGDPFGFKRLTYLRTVEESMRLNDFPGPCVIISASGMCEAGRILHHLKNHIENPKNTVLIVGYMAHNTLGKKLVDRWERVKIFGEEYRLRAQVVVFNALSAHADRRELLDYVASLDRTKLRKVFLVHGDEDQAAALAEGIRELGLRDVFVPDVGESFEVFG